MEENNQLNLYIQTQEGTKLGIKVNKRENISTIKRLCENHLKISSANMHIIYQKKSLQDAVTLQEVNVQDGEILILKLNIQPLEVLPQPLKKQEIQTSAVPQQPQQQQKIIQSFQMRLEESNHPISFLANIGIAEDQEDNPEQIQHMLNKPETKQNLIQVLKNPNLLESLINNNPQLKKVVNDTPNMKQMLQNPEMIQQTIDMINKGQLTYQGFTGYLNSVSSGLPSCKNPEIEYKFQLEQLEKMGFTNREQNKDSLVRTRGDIYAAIEFL